MLVNLKWKSFEILPKAVQRTCRVL